MTKQKSPEKTPRYKYSLLKKEIAPSVIFVPMLSRASRMPLALTPSVSYSDLFSFFIALAMTDSSNLTVLTKRALTTPQKIAKTELPIMKA
jgi:hypothetical protein